MISNVSEVTYGGAVIGYTITFTSGKTITLYNGKDGAAGQNGTDGQDGYTPSIGVAQDTDGIYYWTVDSQWLTDANGNKIAVTSGKGDKGEKGDAGQDGTNGADGADGKTPQLKIEDGYWYLSYDGTNWTKLGKATGENGAKGDTGDNMFSSVTQDHDYVYFTLADGCIIKIEKNNETDHTDSDIIEFKDLNVKRALLRYTPSIDLNGDGEISFREARAVKRLYFQDASINDVLSFIELKYFENLKYYGRSSSLTIDESLKDIQTNLFEIAFPDGLDTIGANAFSNSQLLNISIPTGCKVIEHDAFTGCKNIMVSFPEQSQCEYIDYNANVKIQGFLLPNSIKYIGSGGVVYGGKTAYIPESFEGEVKRMNYDTILWNAVNFQEPYKWTNTNISLYGLWQVNYNDKTTNTTIKSILFGEKVQNIPDYLCYSLSGLTEVTIPESVSIIGISAFQKCTSLKKIYCKNTTPPIIGTNAFPNTINIIYVPNQSVNEYRTNWSDYASKILGYNFE